MNLVNQQLDELSLLDEIIRKEDLCPHFQPILDMKSGAVLGYEALIRGPQGSPLQMPAKLFSVAEAYGRLAEFEILCRRLTLQRFAELKLPHKLFLNMSAALLSMPDYRPGRTLALLKELGIPQEQIVLELSEKHPLDDEGLTRAAVQHYRDSGFMIALDDLGAGYSGLRLWSELRPDYVKVDMHFIRDVEKDSVKREFLRAINNISYSLRCRVIAEGIETKQELHALQDLGVELGQGFLLGRPKLKPVEPDPQPVRQAWGRMVQHSSEVSGTALALLKETPTLQQSDSALFASQLFEKHPDMTGIPVLHEGRPVGVVRRHELLERFSARYGRALYEQKPVSKVMSRNMLLVDSSASLEHVSQQVTENDHQQMAQEILITQDGCYLGMGSVRDLLRRMTEMKIRNARYANPLTLLPGNVPVNQEVERLLTQTTDFRVGYFDLNNFKPFNDCYGYSRGDEVIRLVGELLNRHARTRNNFVGHVGGDDFVVIFRSPDWQERCIRILDDFDEAVTEFYSPRDLQAGGIWSLDRGGKRQFYDLLGLAVGVVHPDPYQCGSFHEVGELAALAKKAAKKAGGSAIFVSPQRQL